MTRDRRHILISQSGKAQPFKAKGSASSKFPSDVIDRQAHAQQLLSALDNLPDILHNNLPGVYLDITGRPGEIMVTKSLGTSGLTLLKVTDSSDDTDASSEALVFATLKGLDKLRKKIEDFAGELPVNEEGQTLKPKNAPLVQSIASIVEAGLSALWRGPIEKFPMDDAPKHWEIWLERSKAETFYLDSILYGVTLGTDRLDFPEDTVFIGYATAADLAIAVRKLGGVRALAMPTTTADYFDDLPVEEQPEWVDSILEQTTYVPQENAAYVTLLDKGVSLSHPLIQPALHSDDRHAAEPAWSVEDYDGHGTQLAGLVLYGDLTPVIQSTLPITVNHRLESVKIIPDAGTNPHHLLGAVTRQGINVVENFAQRRRVYSLASTTDEDSPHDGAPTSWSTEIDQLVAGVSGDFTDPRLMVISAGNSNQNLFNQSDYLLTSDSADNELESPSHAWNAICVGAYTQKTTLPEGMSGSCIAPMNDLSPSSRTASWSSHWPIKPDVVLEGGNWVGYTLPPPMKHAALSLLTTDRAYPLRSFTTTGDTSAATALAARSLSELWSYYPDLRPETIRGLFVSSARWSEQMLTHLPASLDKKRYTKLFQRYGYGIPDMERAKRSASNAITLITEDTIIPYRKSSTAGAEPVHNEMKLFELPWPIEALRDLGNTQVTLRVTLSTYILPNPAEPDRGTGRVSKYRYASHNLRFKLKRADESINMFAARINKLAEQTEIGSIDGDDGWTFGSNRRDVGSLHIDELTCAASDLAQRNVLAVHPVSGWWKSKSVMKENIPVARFSLIVEIDAGSVETDLYAEVQAAIAIPNEIVV